MVPHKSWRLYHLIKVKIVQEFYSFSYLFISTLRAVFGHGLLSRLFPSLRLLLKNEQYGFNAKIRRGRCEQLPLRNSVPTTLMVIRRLGGFHSIFGRQAVDCCCESQRWGKILGLKILTISMIRYTNSLVNVGLFYANLTYTTFQKIPIFHLTRTFKT